MSGEVKLTPGEWRAVNIDGQGWTVVSGETVIAIIGGGGNGEDYEPEYEADARLMAASKVMFEVAREACAIFDLNREGDEYNGDLASDLMKSEIHEKLTAIILKATASGEKS